MIKLISRLLVSSPAVFDALSDLFFVQALKGFHFLDLQLSRLSVPPLQFPNFDHLNQINH